MREAVPGVPPNPCAGQARWDRLAGLLTWVIAHRRESGTGYSAGVPAVPIPRPRAISTPAFRRDADTDTRTGSAHDSHTNAPPLEDG
jgi:hypothetical protein